jgi:DNA repair photolyase
MPMIYIPSGKAREYSPLALNIFNGCDHGCTYCYVPSATFRPDANIRPIKRKTLLADLEKELKKFVPKEQILLCFLCDPYPVHDVETCVTREVLEILKKYECCIAILSKGGKRILRDLDIFKSYPAGKIKIGTTLTFLHDEKRAAIEPNAAPVLDRMAALEAVHAEGIKTFVSIEPVIDPTESLMAICHSIPFVDQYKVGKLNHDAKREKEINWTEFLSHALTILHEYHKEIYVKEDLRRAAPLIKVTAQESDMDYLSLK